MGKENRKLKVFLCHSKDDKPKVRELYRRLVDDGFDAWLDEEKLIPGQDWDLEIRKAVRESDVVVVCLSNSSTTKAGYVQKEIHFALDVADEQPEGTIFIIPARLEDCQTPTRLGRWQWVNLFEEMGYEKLKSSLVLQAKNLDVDWGVSDSLEVIQFFSDPHLIRIPSGPFLMGSTIEQTSHFLNLTTRLSDADIKNMFNHNNWETPQHTVDLPEYFIGKYPVTNREYQVYVEDAGVSCPQSWDKRL